MASSKTEKKIIIASGASAGLSAAFNAPLAGAIFAVEEIFKYFSPMVLLSTMASAMAADYVSKIKFGMSPIFPFGLEEIQLDCYWLLILLGVLVGAAGAFYNRALVITQKLYKKIPLLNVRTRLLAFSISRGYRFAVPLALRRHQIIGQLHVSTNLTFCCSFWSSSFFFHN